MAEPVSVDVEEVTRETDKAILVVVDGEEEWIPKSVIDERLLCALRGTVR